MKVIFISGGLPTEVLDEYNEKYAKHKTRNIQQWWDYTFAKSLCKACGKDDFFAISFPPVSTFPSSKCLYHKQKEIIGEDGLKIFVPKTWNLPVIKQRNLSSAIYKAIKKIAKKFPNEDIVILTHCIYLQSAKPACKACKKFKNVKMCTIVPDLPEHLTGNALTGNKLLHKLFDRYTKMTLPYKYKFDGYVCFSKWQMEYLNKEKPFIVMEGFMDSTLFDKVESVRFEKPRIVYAGGVDLRYGIKELVDGFIASGISDGELWIYGNGDGESYVKDKTDKGVFYGGVVSREEMLKIEKSADLLVNPRPTMDEFSRCSFPSKLMEYMASGTPTLTSRLGCIEDEYFDKMNFIEEVSESGVKDGLLAVWCDREKAKEKAKNTVKFIREYKSADYQAQKVYEFLEREFKQNDI